MMNNIESDDGRIDTDELWKILRELEADELDSRQRAELMALLDRSPAAQRSYLEYFEMSALLATEAAICSEQRNLPVMARPGNVHWTFRRRLLAAAAILVLAIVPSALLFVRHAHQERLLAHATGDAIWTVDGEVQNPQADDRTVAAGATVAVSSGMLELKFAFGASMVLQGPARVSFPDLDRPVLHHGWLWVDSGQAGKPFEVLTPDLLVRDIGTRFGVKVPRDGPAEVHLVEGKVDVFAKVTKKMLASLSTGESAVVIPADGDSTITALARDPFPEIAGLLASPAGYPGTIRSQSPVGYWRMDELKPGFLSNEMPGGQTGRRNPQVEVDQRGPGPETGFHGFGEDNRSVLVRETAKGVPLSLGATPIHSGLLFKDDFDGTDVPLNGATPDVTRGDVKWVASPIFMRDGSIGVGVGMATVAFTPVDGVIYTLDASVTADDGPNENWIGVGFVAGQTTDSKRFNTGGQFGRVWMLHRAGNTTKPVNRAWLGTNVSDWNWSNGSPLGGAMDMRIVLDTTMGAGAWTATWYAKRPAAPSYTMVRATEPLINESISSAGFSIIGDRLSASLLRFSLSAEPRGLPRPVRDLADGPAQVSRKEGALSFWVRREPGKDRQEILWSAGEGMSDDLMHAHLTADGRVGFFMENGRYDVQVASEEPISDGTWHHLAANWSPESVDLYVDGSLVARDAEFRGMQQGALSELRFGGIAKDSRSAAFTGWIDEIALWDRSLTATEVRQQFQSAIGRR